ncbi:MAG: amidohydrolase family protein [Deltaproteobacteria bacterium]|nr:amidohydrolase family protein [Deltaproteobacteria bacterium]
MVVDGDAHVNETEQIFLHYLEPRYRERRPRMVTHENGCRYWLVEGRLVPRPEGRGPGSPRGFLPGPGRTGGSDFDLSDVEARLKDMDEEGIDVQVIYPTTLFVAPFMEDAGLAAALCRAYNTYLAERCRLCPDRLKGVAVVPLQDPAEATRELRRAITELGLVGVVIPGLVGERNLDDPAFFPFFEEADRLDVAVGVHAVTGAYDTPGQERFTSFFYSHAVAMPFNLMIGLLTLVGGGILERLQRVRFAFLETGAGWAPYWSWWLDEHYEKGRYRESPMRYLGREELPHLKRRPSEYLTGGRCFFSCELDERGPRRPGARKRARVPGARRPPRRAQAEDPRRERPPPLPPVGSRSRKPQPDGKTSRSMPHPMVGECGAGCCRCRRCHDDDDKRRRDVDLPHADARDGGEQGDDSSSHAGNQAGARLTSASSRSRCNGKMSPGEEASISEGPGAGNPHPGICGGAVWSTPVLPRCLIHQAELLVAWDRLQAGRPPGKIEPLR